MTSCVHLKKLGSLSFGTGILVGGWRQSVRKSKVKKERDVKILLKNNVYTHCFKRLFIAHLLCVHIVFKQYFDIPFLSYLSFTYSILPLSILPLKYQS